MLPPSPGSLLKQNSFLTQTFEEVAILHFWGQETAADKPTPMPGFVAAALLLEAQLSLSQRRAWKQGSHVSNMIFQFFCTI